MLLQANAKLNWTLDVLGRRTDGYHLLDTLMSPISLCDDIEITLSPDISIICENMDLPCDEHNTAYRAVKAYYGLAARREARPSASPSASPPLRAGRGQRRRGRRAARPQRAPWRSGQLRHAQGCAQRRGGCALLPDEFHGPLAGASAKKITVFPSGGPLHLLLVMGRAGVSTAALFQSLKMDKLLHPDTDSAEAALRTGDPVALAPHLKNACFLLRRERPPNPGDSGTAAEGRRTGRQHDGLRSMLFRLFPTEEEAVRAAPAFSDLPFSAVCRS